MFIFVLRVLSVADEPAFRSAYHYNQTGTSRLWKQLSRKPMYKDTSFDVDVCCPHFESLESPLFSGN